MHYVLLYCVVYNVLHAWILKNIKYLVYVLLKCDLLIGLGTRTHRTMCQEVSLLFF